MFLYMFAFMITSVVEQAFFVNKACLVNNNFTADICDNLNEYPEIKKQVQVSVVVTCGCVLDGWREIKKRCCFFSDYNGDISSMGEHISAHCAYHFGNVPRLVVGSKRKEDTTADGLIREIYLFLYDGGQC